MSVGVILRHFSKMAISRDLGQIRRRAYTHFKAKIRCFRLIWVSSPNSLQILAKSNDKNREKSRKITKNQQKSIFADFL